VLLAQQSTTDALNAQDSSLQSSVDSQKRIDALDDTTRDLLNEYRSTLSQVQDLDAYNEQLDRLVATQRVEIADYERQFQEIEVTKRRILPLIVRMIEVLEEFVGIDIPYTGGTDIRKIPPRHRGVPDRARVRTHDRGLRR
jgi:hypothetical protein